MYSWARLVLFSSGLGRDLERSGGQPGKCEVSLYVCLVKNERLYRKIIMATGKK